MSATEVQSANMNTWDIGNYTYIRSFGFTYNFEIIRITKCFITIKQVKDKGTLRCKIKQDWRPNEIKGGQIQYLDFIKFGDKTLWAKFFKKRDYCDACEGLCRSLDTESCECCDKICKIGCANNPSNESIFNDKCDNCREEEEEEVEIQLTCFKCDKKYMGLEGNCCCGKCCSYCKEPEEEDKKKVEEKEEEEEEYECIGCGQKMGECPAFSCCGRMKILNEKKWTGEDKLRGGCEGCADFCESCYDKYQEDPEWEDFEWEYLGLTTEKEIQEEDWCEVGQHNCFKSDIWEDFTDCKNCVSEKEYKERMKLATSDKVCFWCADESDCE